MNILLESNYRLGRLIPKESSADFKGWRVGRAVLHDLVNGVVQLANQVALDSLDIDTVSLGGQDGLDASLDSVV